MARPTKQGIDYFPLDCRFDDKIEMYIIEKGAVGLAVLVSIWQMIYSNEGYYISNGKDLHLLLKRKIDVDANEISDCINVCLERNIFANSIHKKHQIITSKAIQKRYFEAGKKKKEIKIISDLLLIDVSAYDNVVSVGINSIDSSENATNVNVKEKEKVKEKVYTPNFIKIWDQYPRKEGRKEALRHFHATVKTENDFIRITKAINNYLKYIDVQEIEYQFIKMGSTWFNNWEDYENFKIPEKKDKGLIQL